MRRNSWTVRAIRGTYTYSYLVTIQHSEPVDRDGFIHHRTQWRLHSPALHCFHLLFISKSLQIFYVRYSLFFSILLLEERRAYPVLDLVLFLMRNLVQSVIARYVVLFHYNRFGIVEKLLWRINAYFSTSINGLIYNF